MSGWDLVCRQKFFGTEGPWFSPWLLIARMERTWWFVDGGFSRPAGVFVLFFAMEDKLKSYWDIFLVFGSACMLLRRADACLITLLSPMHPFPLRMRCEGRVFCFVDGRRILLRTRSGKPCFFIYGGEKKKVSLLG